MAILTFKSPGVSTREIDLSGPTAITPAGVPAGVVGTAVRGPAFVPITVATFQDFISKFGNTDGEKFGPLAMNEWLRNANAGTYIRLLGVGDAKKRTDSGVNAGKVNRAGFVVGSEQVQGNGFVGINPYAHGGSDASEASIVFDGAAANYAASDEMTITVPAGQGGEGDTKIILALGAAGAPVAGRMRIKIDRLAFTAADISQLLVFAINGTVPTGDAPSGAGAYEAADIQFPVAGNGQSGVQGITATLDGTNITIKADQMGAVGPEIQFADVGASDIVEDGFGSNPSAMSGLNLRAGGALGRTYILGHFASSSNDYLRETGLVSATDTTAKPIIRGMVLAPSGVHLSLRSIAIDGNQPSTGTNAPGGSAFGDVVTGSSKQEFVMILNGHKVSDASTQIITASFDPHAPNYFSKIFNTDATQTEKMGHYLYTHYDVFQSQAVVTASGVTTHVDSAGGVGLAVQTAFLLTGSESRNAGTAGTSTTLGVPNFENFEDRFRTAYSPYVISQRFGGRNKNIFKVHALDDGRAGSDTFKITIENIQASTNENNPYGKFDLAVRYLTDSDAEPLVLERFAGLDLNPSSDNYIARRIGDTHTYYDFDKATSAQKLVIDGTYPNISNYIRIEMSPEAEDGVLNDTAIPVGFRGLNHLVTSGSTDTDGHSVLTGSTYNSFAAGFTAEGEPTATQVGIHPVQPPIPLRQNISKGVTPKKTADAKLTWGVQFEVVDSVSEPNKNQKFNESIRSFVRYMPDFHTVYQNPSVGGNEGVPDVGGSILDADRFNNNMFTLERVQVLTSSGDRPDPKQWESAVYRRTGQLSGSLVDIDGNDSGKTRFLNPGTDFAHLPSRKYLKFTFPLQGGFDGVNVFDSDKSKFSDAALRREMDNADAQGGSSGPTVASYRKAIRVMEEKTDVDIQLLAIPGIRHESVTDYAIESVENRFDAMYIMDIEERDTLNNPVTGSTEIINVRNTVDNHAGRNFDTSFAAAYFPDVVIRDPATLTNVQCPPSVAVLGAFAFNDSVAHPWFAPAGFNRGALATTIESQVKLNRTNLDDLYDADINPITSFPSTPGVVVFGQKTLLAASSALDRVNVRRLLIDVRRQVKTVANSLLFEPNRDTTLSKFSNAVTPILTRIQQQQGLQRFRVQIDTSTTTQADVENNTIRGKIFLQPTKSIEFISLDFVVTNAGADV